MSWRAEIISTLWYVYQMMSKAFIGKPAPDFATKAVFDGDFVDVKLSDYKGKYVVLFFYPLDL
ncbi:hypothetical protein ANCCAN_22157 [Ancylostoma caninum]|uniref:thioredoxin-dependent peroxiredoxin n=1 Tax=Ancylostoma caninum TaxID=29170 RepID=A0A368FIU3_ANCCA|nr:hypothetical protein ANCCAN_22157 [Ancylostoma caninum]